MDNFKYSFSVGILLPIIVHLLMLAIDEEDSPVKLLTKSRQDDDTNFSENGTLARSEANRVRLFCWMMTDPNISASVIPIKETWWKFCDYKIFFSSAPDPDLPAVGLMVPPGRKHIAKKSRMAWKYIRKHYAHKADFFLKADPDSFIVVENLKMFLRKRDPHAPEFYGHKMKYDEPWHRTFFDGTYAAGQAIVLTREAVVRLADNGIRMDCFMDGEAEDLKTAACLARVGVYLADTRNKFTARETFFPPFHLSHIISGLRLPDWYIQYRPDLPVCQNINCLSDKPIVFHYAKPYLLYMIDYFFNQQQSLDWFVQEKFNSNKFIFNGTLFKLKKNTKKNLKKLAIF